MAPNKKNTIAAPSSNNLFIENLMSRLQLRPPYLDTNSFLSQSLDDFLLSDDDDDDDDDDDEGDLSPSPLDEEGSQRRHFADEEAKLESEIVRIVVFGEPLVALKPNSGQSVDVGGHSICVGFHEEPKSGYRIWEWHGHIAFFDEDNGFSTEYVYGNYFERLPPEMKGGKEKEQRGNPGLKDLIMDSKDRIAGRGGRILHRNSLNAGSTMR